MNTFFKKKKKPRLFITKMRNTRSRRAVTCSFLRETGMLRLSGTGFLAHFDGGVNPSKYHSVKKMLCRNSQPVSICAVMSHESGIYITPFPKARGPRQRRRRACKSARGWKERHRVETVSGAGRISSL